jgi:hypothetical protein
MVNLYFKNKYICNILWNLRNYILSTTYFNVKCFSFPIWILPSDFKNVRYK